MALVLTQRVTEINTIKSLWVVKPGRHVRLTTHHHLCANCQENVSSCTPYRPPWLVTRIAYSPLLVCLISALHILTAVLSVCLLLPGNLSFLYKNYFKY
jgi:hypothetical protein